MDKFTSLHFAFMIWGTAIVGLKTYPTIYMRDGGRDSWIIMIIASIIFFFFFLYLVNVCKKSKCFNLYEIYCSALGRFLGSLLFLSLLITLLLTMLESAAVEGNSMHTNMLLDTPPWFFIIFLGVASIYTVKKGKVALTMVTLIGITLIMMAGINLAILTSKYKHFKYLFPLLENGFHGGQLYCLVQILGLYGSAIIALPFLDEIKEKNKLIRDTIIGLIVLIQMEIISTTGVIMTFGTMRSNLFSYPKLIQTQLVDYWGFLESGELYVMLQIVGGWYLKYSITFFILVKVLKSLGITNKYIHYIISIIVVPIAMYLGSNLPRLYWALNSYAYISFANFFAIPLIVFMIYSIKSRKSKHKNNTEQTC